MSVVGRLCISHSTTAPHYWLSDTYILTPSLLPCVIAFCAVLGMWHDWVALYGFNTLGLPAAVSVPLSIHPSVFEVGHDTSMTRGGGVALPSTLGVPFPLFLREPALFVGRTPERKALRNDRWTPSVTSAASAAPDATSATVRSYFARVLELVCAHGHSL